MNVLDDATNRKIWDDIKSWSNYPNIRCKFISEVVFKNYRLDPEQMWNANQENLINSFFLELSDKDIYALDWQHDCFEYNPSEEIVLDTWRHDEERNCNVYFPSYWPDGDYHAFCAKDYSYGMFGHPWFSEIYVVGKELICIFEKYKEQLKIVEIE